MPWNRRRPRPGFALAALLLAVSLAPWLPAYGAGNTARLQHAGTVTPSLALSPVNASVAVGSTGFVAVTMDPGGSDAHQIDGAQFALRYDASIVDVLTTGFTPEVKCPATSPTQTCAGAQAATKGQTVNFTGSNFAANLPVTISLGDTSKPVNASSSGGFTDSIVAPSPASVSCIFKIPFCHSHKLTASQTVNGQTVTITRNFSVNTEVMNILSGDSQNGTVGMQLAQPLVVQVSAASLAGNPVAFSISGPSTTTTGQALSVTAANTDANGQLQTLATLGNESGIYTIKAQVDLNDAESCLPVPSCAQGNSPGETVEFHVRAVAAGASTAETPVLAAGSCALVTALQNEVLVDPATQLGTIRYAAGADLATKTPVTAPCSPAFITFKGKAPGNMTRDLTFLGPAQNETLELTEGGKGFIPNVTNGTVFVSPSQPPTISDITDKSTSEDTATAAIPFTVGDPDNDVATLTPSGTSSNTAIVPNANITFGGSGANRTVTVTPAPDANGQTTITVCVSDGVTQTCDTFVLTVTAVNDKPVAEARTVTTAEDTALAVTLSAADIDSPSLTFSIVAGPAHGSLGSTGAPACTASGSAPVGPGVSCTASVTYTPAQDFSGSDSFTYRASDGSLNSDTVTVSITVTAVNDPPVLATNAGLTVGKGLTGTIGSSNLLVTDVDNTAAQLSYTIGTAPAHGTLKKSGSALAAGGSFTQDDINSSRIIYTHDGSDATGTGADGFSFTVSDGAGGGISTRTFNINVTVGPRLEFGRQPSGGIVSTAWRRQPTVVLRDTSGNIMTTDSVASVSLSIKAGTGTAGAQLSGCTAALTASGGIVAFSGCATTTEGSGYILVASATEAGTTFTPGESAPFNVGTAEVFLDPSVRRVRPSSAAPAAAFVAPFTLNVTAPPAKVSGVTVQIGYDSSIVSVASCTTNASAGSGSCSNGPPFPNPLVISVSNSGGISGTLKLADISFSVAGTRGTSSLLPVTIVDIDDADPLGPFHIPNAAASGSRLVSGCLPYDVNCSGSVTVTDATCILRFIVGGFFPPFTTTCPEFSEFDGNRNGTVAVSDATCVLRKVVGGFPASTTCPGFTDEAGDARLLQVSPAIPLDVAANDELISEPGGSPPPEPSTTNITPWSVDQ